MMCRHVEVLCKQDASYESRISDWSSGVCSSDLGAIVIKPRLRIETPIWKPIGEHRNCGRRQRLVDLARTAQQFAEELIEPARHQLPSGAGCSPRPGAVTTVSPCAVAAIAAAVAASAGGTSKGWVPFRVAGRR